MIVLRPITYIFPLTLFVLSVTILPMDTPKKDSPDIITIQATRDTTPKYALTIPGVAVLLADNKDVQTIADTFDVSYQAVRQFIQRNADRLKALTDNDKLLSYKIKDRVCEIVDSIQASDIKKAGLSQKMIAVGIGIEKSRLLDGKSTANIHTLSQYIIDADSVSEELIIPQDQRADDAD